MTRRPIGELVDARGHLMVAGVVAAHTSLTAILLLAAGVSPALRGALIGLSSLVSLAIIVWLTAVACGLHRAGCCSACNGQGVGGSARVESHGGACWDCRSTGHPHRLSWWHR